MQHEPSQRRRSTRPRGRHPLQRRYHAEALVRLRRADDELRFAASQRAGRIDPNPHQLDAVLFALGRIPEGGCILADEVGLGKTIEAGLVIAQLLAEGARRILLITPKSLMGQWREELYTLFGLTVREGRADPESFEGPGIFLVGREAAGSRPVAARIGRAAPFDLAVIDEAHELFAGIHRRYDGSGTYREDSPHAKIAHRVRRALGQTPVLLLTATPIQNSLAELWGLVQYVDPSGTLLGDLPTFRAVFTARGDERRLAPGAEHELRRRLGQVVQRTLRRQAQPFMSKPFVGRRTRTFEYAMSPAEKALYDDVTRYLLRADLQAFRGSHRSLLLLGFHRRMASSKAALAASLANVVTRLDRMIRAAEVGRRDEGDETAQIFADDLDDDEIAEALRAEERDEGATNLEAARAERALVAELAERAAALHDDGKARALIQVVRRALADGGKVVVFTESLTTQDYLRQLLLESGLVTDAEITLFRGQNTSPRARQALQRWEAEVESAQPARSRPSRQVAMRLALVHEFRTRSKVFLSTEAGAKGLNLQFASTLVNYDLPWNPQRIEQRIGRCHRYGQTQDVTVINFLAKDNAAQRLTYEILAQKLELFGTVLGASDEVLHEARADGTEAALALGLDFERQLGEIYRQARSIEEIEAGLRKLRDETDARRRAFEEQQARTASLIESRLDETVRATFRGIAERLPERLGELDARLDVLLRDYLEAVGANFERTEDGGRVRYRIAPGEALPPELRDGAEVTVGGGDEGEPLHLAHPLVTAALEETRRATARCRAIRLLGPTSAERGRLLLLRFRYDGLEPVERIHVLAFALQGSELRPLAPEAGRALLDLEMEDVPAPKEPLPDAKAVVADAVEELLFREQASIDAGERERFDRHLDRLERFVADRVLVLERERAALQARLEAATEERDRAMSADARRRAEDRRRLAAEHLETVDARLDALRRRADETYEEQRSRLYARSFTAPKVDVLVDVEWTR